MKLSYFAFFCQLSKQIYIHLLDNILMRRNVLNLFFPYVTSVTHIFWRELPTFLILLFFFFNKYKKLNSELDLK